MAKLFIVNSQNSVDSNAAAFAYASVVNRGNKDIATVVMQDLYYESSLHKVKSSEEMVETLRNVFHLPTDEVVDVLLLTNAVEPPFTLNSRVSAVCVTGADSFLDTIVNGFEINIEHVPLVARRILDYLNYTTKYEDSELVYIYHTCGLSRPEWMQSMRLNNNGIKTLLDKGKAIKGALDYIRSEDEGTVVSMALDDILTDTVFVCAKHDGLLRDRTLHSLILGLHKVYNVEHVFGAVYGYHIPEESDNALAIDTFLFRCTNLEDTTKLAESLGKPMNHAGFIIHTKIRK